MYKDFSYYKLNLKSCKRLIRKNRNNKVDKSKNLKYIIYVKAKSRKVLIKSIKAIINR